MRDRRNWIVIAIMALIFGALGLVIALTWSSSAPAEVLLRFA